MLAVVKSEPKQEKKDDFAQFWKQYPRKVARIHAEKMWRLLTPDEQAAAIAAIPNHIRQWQTKGKEIEFIPHPGSWLNGKRFEDELPALPGATVTPTKTCCKCKIELINGRTMTSAGWMCDECWQAR